jgi:hypothetical protein
MSWCVSALAVKSITKTTQKVIIKDEIYVKMVALEGYAFLPPYKRKTFAKFKQKLLQIINQSLLYLRFKVFTVFF